MAQDDLTLLKEQLLQSLQQTKSEGNKKELLKFYRWNDGTIRSLPQNQPTSKFDANKYATTYIGRNVKLTTQLKQRLFIVNQLISSFGLAWSNRFINTYYLASENAIVIYWKGIPWSLRAKSNLYLLNEEFFRVSIPENNPSRRTAWTGVYADLGLNNSMVTAITPVDDENGKFIGVLGHDITLTDLIKNTINEHLPGTYNLIFRDDGHLIAHPEFMDKIQNSEGQLTIDELNNSHLSQIFKLVKQNQDTGIIENNQDQEYLAVTKIQGPDWYLVTVYPKSLLSGFAFDTVKFTFFTGLIALVVEIYLLASVLHSSVAVPLNQLIDITHQIATGDFDIDIDANRQDEIGQLTAAFNIMAIQIRTSFSDLEQINSELEQRIEERTIELQNVLRDLQQTQGQMLQSEKMSALGQMVAGIAHEINNPVSFIHGNLSHIEQYTCDLLQLIQVYQEYYPQPPLGLQQTLEAIDFEFLSQDIYETIKSMKVGTNRIRDIVKSLRSFSRLDEAECKKVDIHEGIDDTLLILQHRLSQTSTQPAITIVKEYGQLPLVECYAGQLNQVFMNLLSNAIDALNEVTTTTPTIWISTHITNNNWVQISIADNGIGMTDETRARLFDPFFTTKEPGKGTGLGLSISYQIVVETHHGQLICDSSYGTGTKFIIKIPVKNNS
ncbi:MAG: HAMP domain-containing protein [Calothrix sp. C42_A2020_038]|nr:HAMP domain-containing protein [Calothrix sp. C42_A2020_038]